MILLQEMRFFIALACLINQKKYMFAISDRYKIEI